MGTTVVCLAVLGADALLQRYLFQPKIRTAEQKHDQFMYAWNGYMIKWLLTFDRGEVPRFDGDDFYPFPERKILEGIEYLKSVSHEQLMKEHPQFESAKRFYDSSPAAQRYLAEREAKQRALEKADLDAALHRFQRLSPEEREKEISEFVDSVIRAKSSPPGK